MATVQICVDDILKQKADVSAQHNSVKDSLLEAISDSRYRQNLCGPFDNAEDAVASMFED